MKTIKAGTEKVPTREHTCSLCGATFEMMPGDLHQVGEVWDATYIGKCPECKYPFKYYIPFKWAKAPHWYRSLHGVKQWKVVNPTELDDFDCRVFLMPED